MTLRLDAAQLLPGDGDPIPDGSVLIDDGTITWVGATADLAPDAPTAADATVPTLMPGMWECHGHLIGARSAAINDMFTEPVHLRAARTVVDLKNALDAGFTSIRDAGGYGVHLARGVAEGSFPGPTIYGAGAILSTTGGHADTHALPEDWVHELAHHDTFQHVCDGISGVVHGVRSQLRRDAKVIKICASGGVISDVDDPIHQQFTNDELAAIIEVAGMADRAVMAHCHGKPGIVAALEAGVTTIEHGSYLDEETAVMMRELGAILVPTRFIVDTLVKVGREQGMNPLHQTKLDALSGRHLEAIGIAKHHGVTIANGTDIFQTGLELPVSWGRNGAELGLMVEAGLTPLEAIATATANAPATLGPQAPKSGRLEAGHDADIIAVAGDPVADITLLADPSKITHVWQAGTQVKTT